MEDATYFSVLSADLQRTTRRYIPKDRILLREKILELNENPVRANIVITIIIIIIIVGILHKTSVNISLSPYKLPFPLLLVIFEAFFLKKTTVFWEVLPYSLKLPTFRRNVLLPT
jgi:uncharacterized integral membrane protein